MEGKMESRKSWNRRVEQATGLRAQDVRHSKVAEDLLGGQILCRRGNTYLVTVGYPTVDMDGETFHDFVVVAL
jgi:hypothetical protein